MYNPSVVRFCLLPVFLLLTLMMSGCSLTTAYFPYPQKIAGLRADLVSGTELKLESLYRRERKGPDRLLYNLEYGRAAQIVGATEVSRTAYARAIEKLRSNEQRAVVSAAALGATAAALVVNDNTLPYAGAGYERVFLHHYQALNYLLQGDVEGAGVEFRWANSEQDAALQRHQQELERVQRTGRDVSPAAGVYAQLDELAGQVKNSFQNAYSFYLSGLVYELLAAPNDAYIDYKRALEIYPENRYVQQDVMRLARRIGMDEEIRELTARFPHLGAMPSDRAQGGELVLLLEDSLVPEKHAVSVAFPFPEVGFIPLSLPVYAAADRYPDERFNAYLDGTTFLGLPDTICAVDRLAAKALQERMPAVIARQVARMTAKAVAAKAAGDRFGSLGQFAVNIYNLVSEQADLRSWSTLPASARILRNRLSAGAHTITLMDERGGEFTTEIAIHEQHVTLLYVIRVGWQYYAASVVL